MVSKKRTSCVRLIHAIALNSTLCVNCHFEPFCKKRRKISFFLNLEIFRYAQYDKNSGFRLNSSWILRLFLQKGSPMTARGYALALWILLRAALLVPHFCYAKTATPISSARNDKLLTIIILKPRINSSSGQAACISRATTCRT